MTQGFDYTGISVNFFCVDGKGRIFLAKRSKNARDEHGRWDTGGGALEFGEDIEERLKKEIKEELCVDILEYEFLGYRDVHRIQEGRPTHWITLGFKVLVDPEQVKNGEPHKFDEIGWFTLDNLPSPLHSQALPALEKFRSKLFK